jgi:hypothetical protein
VVKSYTGQNERFKAEFAHQTTSVNEHQSFVQQNNHCIEHTVAKMRVAEGFKQFVLHRGLARGIQTQLHNPALSLQPTVRLHGEKKSGWFY